MNEQSRRKRRFVLCVRNDSNEIDLDTGTIYMALLDEQAEQRGRLRIVDESGEDYLYPRHCFQPVELSPSLRSALSHEPSV